MSESEPEPIHVTRRIDLPCHALGFTPPPCRVDLMFLSNDGSWTLLVHSKTAGLDAVGRWVASYGPTQVQTGEGRAPRVHRATFDQIPALWSDILRSVRSRSLQLTPSGIASLFYEDDDVTIPLLLNRLHRSRTTVHVRRSEGHISPDSGGTRQFDALSLAVALGYYDTPRRVDLNEVAGALGMPYAATTDLLRRAEARAVTAHVDSSMMRSMDGRSFLPILDADEKARMGHGGRKAPEPVRAG